MPGQCGGTGLSGLRLSVGWFFGWSYSIISEEKSARLQVTLMGVLLNARGEKYKRAWQDLQTPPAESCS